MVEVLPILKDVEDLPTDTSRGAKHVQMKLTSQSVHNMYTRTHTLYTRQRIMPYRLNPRTIMTLSNGQGACKLSSHLHIDLAPKHR